jgi:hypothetical protein
MLKACWGRGMLVKRGSGQRVSFMGLDFGGDGLLTGASVEGDGG